MSRGLQRLPRRVGNCFTSLERCSLHRDERFLTEDDHPNRGRADTPLGVLGDKTGSNLWRFQPLSVELHDPLVPPLVRLRTLTDAPSVYTRQGAELAFPPSRCIERLPAGPAPERRRRVGQTNTPPGAKLTPSSGERRFIDAELFPTTTATTTHARRDLKTHPTTTETSQRAVLPPRLTAHPDEWLLAAATGQGDPLLARHTSTRQGAVNLDPSLCLAEPDPKALLTDRADPLDPPSSSQARTGSRAEASWSQRTTIWPPLRHLAALGAGRIWSTVAQVTAFVGAKPSIATLSGGRARPEPEGLTTLRAGAFDGRAPSNTRALKRTEPVLQLVNRLAAILARRPRKARSAHRSIIAKSVSLR